MSPPGTGLKTSDVQQLRRLSGDSPAAQASSWGRRVLTNVDCLPTASDRWPRATGERASLAAVDASVGIELSIAVAPGADPRDPNGARGSPIQRSPTGRQQRPDAADGFAAVQRMSSQARRSDPYGTADRPRSRRHELHGGSCRRLRLDPRPRLHDLPPPRGDGHAIQRERGPEELIPASASSELRQTTTTSSPRRRGPMQLSAHARPGVMGARLRGHDVGVRRKVKTLVQRYEPVRNRLPRPLVAAASPAPGVTAPMPSEARLGHERRQLQLVRPAGSVLGVQVVERLRDLHGVHDDLRVLLRAR